MEESLTHAMFEYITFLSLSYCKVDSAGKFELFLSFLLPNPSAIKPTVHASSKRPSATQPWDDLQSLLDTLK